jgi:hypothetical protein
MAGDPEDKINKVFSKLKGYTKDLGIVQFKKRQFRITIEVESEKTHGKRCKFFLPFGGLELETELGDLIVAVDYILDDPYTPNNSRKIVEGTCSMIQTKKESYAKKGLSARQLYLMTQWPEFRYKKHYWKFALFSDISSFYLFVLEPTSQQKQKSSVLSTPMLVRLLGVNKSNLLKNIKGLIPFSQTDLLVRERINGSLMPLSFTSFLLKSLHLNLGSQSLDVRNFLRQNFFPTMEEVEDCYTTTQVERQRQIKEYDPFRKNMHSGEEDDYIYAVRFKVIIKRVE